MKLSHKILGGILAFIGIGLVVGGLDCVFAAENIDKVASPYTAWAFLSAAISTGLSSVAAGFAVAYVGAAAVGAVSEKPEMAGRALIFVGLAEGIAIYGLIIAIMILGKI